MAIHTSQGTNIIVTGGTGLIGSSIPFGVKPTRKQMDLLDCHSVRSFIQAYREVDTIIHAADAGLELYVKDFIRRYPNVRK